jgi:heat shock protein HslJ
MRSRCTGLVVVTLILMLCVCGCTQLLPSEPRATPSVTRQLSDPTPFPTFPPRSGPPSSTWYLVSLRDGNATVPVIPNTTISAFFDGQGTVSGTSGCNDYTAPFTGSGGNLTVGPPASTRRTCGSPAGVMTQEAAYLARIQEAKSYSVDGMLELMDGRGEVVLTYSPVPNGTPVPAPLQNTTWYVDSFTDAAGGSYSPRGLTTIRLVFGADGSLYGNAGCNNHYGPYQQAGGGSIVIGGQQTTRIYCGIGGVMELERAYLGVLPEMTRYSIAGDTLRLTDAAGKAKIECDTGSP